MPRFKLLVFNLKKVINFLVQEPHAHLRMDLQPVDLLFSKAEAWLRHLAQGAGESSVSIRRPALWLGSVADLSLWWMLGLGEANLCMCAHGGVGGEGGANLRGQGQGWSFLWRSQLLSSGLSARGNFLFGGSLAQSLAMLRSFPFLWLRTDSARPCVWRDFSSILRPAPQDSA